MWLVTQSFRRCGRAIRTSTKTVGHANSESHQEKATSSYFWRDPCLLNGFCFVSVFLGGSILGSRAQSAEEKKISSGTLPWSQRLSFNIIFFLFAKRTALRANKKIKEAVRVAKFANKRIKESLWDQGTGTQG